MGKTLNSTQFLIYQCTNQLRLNGGDGFDFFAFRFTLRAHYTFVS